ncbi:MAG: SCO family protein [Planctomycetes bacterium]|nr:SCO family protein [Planctomycetota bacterium]
MGLTLRTLKWSGPVLLLLCGLHSGTAAEPSKAFSVPAPVLQDVGIDQRLDEQVPLDLPFVDETGKPVKLGDYFDGKPVILVLAYYRCPMLCTLVLNGVVEGMSKIPLVLGKDFRVVTVSFDPRETHELAAVKRKNYLKKYGRPGAADGWHFLTGKQDAIRRLTKAVGFRYVYDKKDDQFIHASGIMILTPTGKISRYLYDVHYSGRDLRLALVEASANKIGSPADQVLLYCFHYDPSAGKYTASVMNFIRLGGVLTMLGIGALVSFLVIVQRRMKKLGLGTSTSDPGSAELASPPTPAAGGSTP